MKDSKGVQSRRLALEALIQIDKQGAFTSNALANAFARTQLSNRDRAFVTALVFGVTRQKTGLDNIIGQFSSQRLEKLPIPLLNTLRLGIFQLEEMSDIPPSAVLNTCANIAKAVGHIGHARFVNGLLRQYLRTKIMSADERQSPVDEIQTATPNNSQSSITSVQIEVDDAAILSTKYSMPQWIVHRWLNNFGHNETVNLLKQAQKPGKLILRACTPATTVEGLITFLASCGVQVRIGSLVSSCLIVEGASKSKSIKGPLQTIPGYADGLFSIQDESSAFVSLVVDPKPGQLVLDLCAAPGGKTTHLAELMNGTGQVIAVDKNAKRLEMIGENRSRLGLTNIQVYEGDARIYTPDKLADRVLLDAPCMGTGVMGRRPDVRYHRSEEDLRKLVRLQRELLEHAADLVKPGGVLVYSTCSLEPEENIENMKWFLESHQNFKPGDLTGYIPGKTLEKWLAEESLLGLQASIANGLSSGYIQLLPSRHGVSGFFVCRMVKGSL